jgi:hypothetical protein
MFLDLEGPVFPTGPSSFMLRIALDSLAKSGDGHAVFLQKLVRNR